MDHRYLIFYKPYDVLSQFSNTENGHTTLKSFISVPGVYPVGRLDRDSEGLLLLSDDGKLQHRLCHPQFRHPRTYWAQVERIPDPKSLIQLCQGVTIRGYTTLPAEATLLAAEPELPPRTPPIRFRKQVPTAWLQLTLREGRNRQVRRMTAAIGFPTLRLVRVSIGHLHLGNLQPGEWRELTSDERTYLHQLTKGYDSLHRRRRQLSRPKIRQRYD
ncbi:pseudouridine synthase [Leptolyngbya sp. Heron Island J]|uniref:pseudouridine synthase n=1 Tax=Leptolyngbya sp. Heron Island J TaxID=1385935 RepID=UPI0003B9593F|nr:pseudouridine synthase [Leptolyngbya sp. Heron Island J]ESA33220.1 pseudouridine synthase [Leptolyngbya sp. Heron Island J]